MWKEFKKSNFRFVYLAGILFAGLIYLLLYLQYGFNNLFVVYLILVSLLIIISIIDLKYLIIPNKLTFGGAGLGFLLLFFTEHLNFKEAFTGLLIPVTLFLILALVYRKGLGIGDVKLVGMIGVYIGWQYTLLAIFIGSLIGSIMGIILIISGKMKRKTRIPFAPLIALGTIIVILGENYILRLISILFIKN